MQKSIWKLAALAGVVGVGFLGVMQAQRGLTRSDGETQQTEFEDFDSTAAPAASGNTEPDPLLGRDLGLPQSEPDIAPPAPEGDARPEPATFASTDEVSGSSNPFAAGEHDHGHDHDHSHHHEHDTDAKDSGDFGPLRVASAEPELVPTGGLDFRNDVAPAATDAAMTETAAPEPDASEAETGDTAGDDVPIQQKSPAPPTPQPPRDEDPFAFSADEFKPQPETKEAPPAAPLAADDEPADAPAPPLADEPSMKEPAAGVARVSSAADESADDSPFGEQEPAVRQASQLEPAAEPEPEPEPLEKAGPRLFAPAADAKPVEEPQPAPPGPLPEPQDTFDPVASKDEKPEKSQDVKPVDNAVPDVADNPFSSPPPASETPDEAPEPEPGPATLPSFGGADSPPGSLPKTAMPAEAAEPLNEPVPLPEPEPEAFEEAPAPATAPPAAAPLNEAPETGDETSDDSPSPAEPRPAAEPAAPAAPPAFDEPQSRPEPAPVDDPPALGPVPAESESSPPPSPRPDAVRPEANRGEPAADDDLAGDAVPAINAPRGPQRPQLSIVKQAPPNATLGEPMIYSILIKNVGNSPANQVTVEDRLPRGARLTGTIPQAEMVDKKLVWKIGTLQPSEQRKIQVRVIPLEAGQIGSVATVNFVAEVASRTLVTSPRLKLDLVGPEQANLGAPVVLRFKVTNNGTSHATGVMLRNLVPEELKHPGGKDLEYAVGNLPAGQSRDIKLTLMAARPGTALTKAVVTADGKVTAEAAARCEVVGSLLELTRRGPKRRYLGRPATYVNRVTNKADRPVGPVLVEETIPDGFEFVRANNGGQYNEAKRTVAWQIESIAAGQSAEVTVELTATTTGAQSSTVTAAGPSGSEVRVNSQTAVIGLAALSANLTGITGPVPAGENITLQIRVNNRGNTSASGVKVDLTLPEHLSFVTSDGPVKATARGRSVSFVPLERLDPQDEETLTVVLKAQSAGEAHLQVRIDSDQLSQPISRNDAVVIFGETR